MKDYRPGYHYLPRKNWINDPCGLIQHKGVYHLYHQMNPHGDCWGDMHWGHATSTDLVNWEEQDAALKPDFEHDEEHCFTGSAYHLPDGRAAFCYTSIKPDRKPQQRFAFPTDDDTLAALVQTQENMLTDAVHAPGMDVTEWRDPVVLRHGEGYLMVLGCRLGHEGGACLLYTSDDGVHFAYHSVLARGGDPDERSWECPNFMRIGDKHVLLYSPFRQAQYIIGTLTDDLRFIPEGRGIVDESDDNDGFYAPQCFRDDRGRQLMIGWMTDRSRGEWAGIKGWSGCMSLPREVYLEDGVLKMRVIDEVNRLAEEGEQGELPVAACKAGDQYRVIIDAELEQDGCITCELLASLDGEEKTVVQLFGNGRLVLDRSRASKHPVHTGLSERRISLPQGKAHLEIYVDHSVIEISGNGEWISSRVYPSREDALELNVRLQGGKGSYALARMKNSEK